MHGESLPRCSLRVLPEQTLQPLVDDGLVEYHYSAPGAVTRGQAHDTCMSEMKHRHAW